MPDQPTPSDEERYALLATTAHLLLDSLEKEDPESERSDPTAFEWGFRCGFFMALDLLAYRLAGDVSDFDPAWTEEEVEDWLGGEAFAALAEREWNEVEWALRRILRDEEGDE